MIILHICLFDVEYRDFLTIPVINIKNLRIWDTNV